MTEFKKPNVVELPILMPAIPSELTRAWLPEMSERELAEINRRVGERLRQRQCAAPAVQWAETRSGGPMDTKNSQQAQKKPIAALPVYPSKYTPEQQAKAREAGAQLAQAMVEGLNKATSQKASAK